MSKFPVLYEVSLIVVVMLIGSVVSHLSMRGDIIFYSCLKVLDDHEIYESDIKGYQRYKNLLSRGQQ